MQAEQPGKVYSLSFKREGATGCKHLYGYVYWNFTWELHS